MQCPACDQVLVPVHMGFLTVDVCKNGCGGAWFDHRELEQIDEENESAGIAMFEVENPKTEAVRAKKRPCPRCPDVILRQRFYGPTRDGVEIDECPACGGIWLDAGELEAIRNEAQPDWNQGYREQPVADTYRSIVEGVRRARKRQRQRNTHWGF